MRKTKLMAAAAALASAALIGGTVLPALPAKAAPTKDVNLSSYVGTSTDASAGLRAAAIDLQTRNGWKGGTINIDGQWTINTTINLDELQGGDTSKRLWNMVRLEGTGIGSSKLTRGVNGPMFQMKSTTPISLYNMAYNAIGFETTVDAASYIWELQSGAVTNSQWEDIAVEIKGQGGVIAVGPTAAGNNGAEYHSNSWRDTMVYVSKDSNYVPFRFTSAHHHVNGNTFDRMWAHHRLNNKKPFFEMKPKNGGTYTNNSFKAITGEQNLGGLLHLTGMNGGTIDSVVDWDGLAPGYNNHVIQVVNSWGTVITGSGFVVQSNYYKPTSKAWKTINLVNNQHVTTLGSAVGTIPCLGTAC